MIKKILEMTSYKNSRLRKTHQPITVLTDGMARRGCGNRRISFIMLAKRTGTSCRKNLYDLAWSPDFEPTQHTNYQYYLRYVRF